MRWDSPWCPWKRHVHWYATALATAEDTDLMPFWLRYPRFTFTSNSQWNDEADLIEYTWQKCHRFWYRFIHAQGKKSAWKWVDAHGTAFWRTGAWSLQDFRLWNWGALGRGTWGDWYEPMCESHWAPPWKLVWTYLECGLGLIFHLNQKQYTMKWCKFDAINKVRYKLYEDHWVDLQYIKWQKDSDLPGTQLSWHAFRKKKENANTLI